MRRQPVQSRSRARVERILTAALELLEEGQSLTTTNIAARADSPVGSLYQYFPNLDALLRALAQRVVEQVRVEAGAVFASAMDATEPGNWELAIDSVVERSVRKFGESVAYRRLLQELRFSDGFHEVLGNLRQQTADDLGSWLRLNGLNEASIDRLCHVLFELLVTLMLCYGEAPSSEEKEQVVMEFKRLIIVYLRDWFEGAKAHT